jgi:hypothetical protein
MFKASSEKNYKITCNWHVLISLWTPSSRYQNGLCCFTPSIQRNWNVVFEILLLGCHNRFLCALV